MLEKTKRRVVALRHKVILAAIPWSTQPVLMFATNAALRRSARAYGSGNYPAMVNAIRDLESHLPARKK